MLVSVLVLGIGTGSFLSYPVVNILWGNPLVVQLLYTSSTLTVQLQYSINHGRSEEWTLCNPIAVKELNPCCFLHYNNIVHYGFYWWTMNIDFITWQDKYSWQLKLKWQDALLGLMFILLKNVNCNTFFSCQGYFVWHAWLTCVNSFKRLSFSLALLCTYKLNNLLDTFLLNFMYV